MKRAAPTTPPRKRPPAGQATGQFKPLLWTFDKALHRMLPGATGEKLVPDDWHPWNKPNNPLPIDDTVEALLKTTQSPRIEKSKLLYKQMLTDGCPYFHARLGIATAIDLATRDCKNWPERSSTTKNLLKRYQGSLKAIQDAIPELVSLSEQIQLSVDHPLAPPLLMGGETIIGAARQLSWAIDNTKFAVDAHRTRWINNPPDIWRVTFVGALANCWERITRTSNPPGTPQAIPPPPRSAAANSEPFKKFVGAAWDSASNSEATFDQAIKYVVRTRSRPPLRIKVDPDELARQRTAADARLEERLRHTGRTLG
jgi:hypothetical protein